MISLSLCLSLLLFFFFGKEKRLCCRLLKLCGVASRSFSFFFIFLIFIPRVIIAFFLKRKRANDKGHSIHDKKRTHQGTGTVSSFFCLFRKRFCFGRQKVSLFMRLWLFCLVEKTSQNAP